jgi:glycosyltransferase involved in cell wall biosynthesis
MRILAASAFEAGAHWAHAINTVKTAEGFARVGHDVRIVCRRPAGGAVPAEALARGYALRAPVRWTQVAARRFGRPLGPHGAFAAQALPRIAWARPHLVYARSYAVPTWTARLGLPTVVESHAHPENQTPDFRRLVQAARRPALRAWITISEVLAEAHARAGVPEGKIRVVPDAVDLDLFVPPDAPGPSPYPSGGPVAAYAGHLYDYKGIPTVLAAAARLPEVRFHLVGGWPEDVEGVRRRVEREGLGNVTLHGLRPHVEVPAFLWHADVLLLPPSAQHASAAWTSPVKLGEYLASGTPVVATSIPALRHWLRHGEVEWAEPDAPEALAAAIRRVLDDPAHAAGLAKRARERAAALSYRHRAERILSAAGLDRS